VEEKTRNFYQVSPAICWAGKVRSSWLGVC